MKRIRATRGDLLVAGVVTVFGVLSVLVTSPAEGTGVDRDADVFAVGIAVLSTAPIALRRSAPFAVLLATCSGLLLASSLGYAVAASGLGPVLAATSVAYLTDRRGTIAAGVTFAVAALVGTLIALRGEPGAGVQLVTTLVIAVLATAVGDVLRTLHARNRELETLREVEAREAVAQDRIRIARDLHDVVGHALVGIALQARAGRRLVERDPVEATEALREIEELASRALGETRETIGLIRAPGQPAELRPQPRLEDLDELVSHLREDDLRVDLRREGDVARVPAVVQASAYRIVQEALSNVLKHAQPASAVVTVLVRDGTLELDVRDDGSRLPADDGQGHGLRGMRERVAHYGGSVDAGPDPAGGWRVHARLPLAGRPA
jgi:signal transduction histidine kinase